MKCNPEEVPAEAVEEYARQLSPLMAKHSAWRGHISDWDDASYGVRAARLEAFRRAIADGAEPEGWRWDPFFIGGSQEGWVLVRKPAPPKPPTVEELRRATDEALDQQPLGFKTNACLRAIVAELRGSR